MPRRLFPRLTGPAAPARDNSRRARLGFDWLEEREVPAVLLRPISEPNIPNDKPVYVPVTVTNTPVGAVTTTVTSSNPAGITAEVVQGGRSVRFDVTGTDRDGVPFSGSLTLRLFEDAAPLASQRIVDLINGGFYANKVFHRIIDNFVIQGGSPTGTGTGGSTLPDLPDEYNPQYTFASRGLLAYANATDDNNDSQFFITDIDVPLANRSQSLNFNHTIFGILTDGFDTYQKIVTTAVNGSVPQNAVTIVGAAVFTDAENAVVKLTPQNGFTGTANVTVSSADASGAPAATQTFATASADDGVNSKPFIPTPVPAQTTTTGTPVTFTVPYTDVDGDPSFIAVRAAGEGFSGNPSDVTVSINQATRQVTLTPIGTFTGPVDFEVGVRQSSAADTEDNYDTQAVRLTISPPPPAAPPPVVPPPPPPNTGPVTAEGSAPGLPPSVTIRNADGSVRFTVPVFDPAFVGGVRAAVADTDLDGDQDVIATAGPGGAPVVLRIDPTTGTVAQTVMVFEDTFRGGLHLRLKDVAGLGYAQVLVGAGDTGGPRVTLLDLRRNVVLQNFFAGDQNFRGGVSVDAGEVFDGRGQTIVTGLGPGAGPVVAFFNPNTGASLGSFVAGDSTSRTGILVSTGTPDATTGVQPVLVTPTGTADGVQGQSFDAADFVDPDRPATTTPTTPGSSTGFEELFG